MCKPDISQPHQYYGVRDLQQYIATGSNIVTSINCQITTAYSLTLSPLTLHAERYYLILFTCYQLLAGP